MLACNMPLTAEFQARRGRRGFSAGSVLAVRDQGKRKSDKVLRRKYVVIPPSSRRQSSEQDEEDADFPQGAY